MRRALLTLFVATGLVGAACAKKSEPSEEDQRGGTASMARESAGPERPARAGEGARPAEPPRRDASSQGLPARAVELWAARGLKVPESVLHDPARKLLYVSCINGKPTEKNGQGFIARLSIEGAVLDLEWARGMDAPKGMGLVGDLLWVTDIDRLHVIDKRTGRPERRIEAPDTKFLNDIAVGPGGEVFVSDMATGKVHKVKDDKLELLADLKPFEGSNGMLMLDGQLYVGSASGIVKVDPATGKAELHVPIKDFGMVDGLKAVGPGAFLVSNWAGRTQIVGKGGQVTPILDTTAQKIQSADFEYIAETRLLLIPTFFDNRVVAYRLEK
ncbi:MAG: ATP-binding protein [Polyangia bacterium]|nr:ATP-binding protein [Polyangia bacterium]